MEYSHFSISQCSQQSNYLCTISEASEQLGIDPDLFALAAWALGCWWIKKPTQQIRSTEAERIASWIQLCGLRQFLVEQHSPLGVEGVVAVLSPAQCPHLSTDVTRIQKLINENMVRLRGLKWKWMVGAILEMLYESPGSMRVIKKRGISLQALEQAILSYPKLKALRNTDVPFDSTVISELKRLHKGRMAWLWVETRESGISVLVDQARATVERETITRESATFAPGEIVWVALEENNNGRRSRKRHPALLLSLTGKRNDKWLLVSLTTDVNEKQDIRKVQDPEALGLPYAGYVWHETQKVYHTQIESHIGWVTSSLVEVVDRTINLRQSMMDELLAIASFHHAESESARF